MPEDVESDEIAKTKRPCLRPAHCGSGQGIDFLDAQVHLLHNAHDVQHGEGADAIGDEVGRVLGVHHTFTQVQIAEVSDGLHQRGIGIGSGNQFQQAHVARRIEEVRTEPAAAEVVRETFGDLGHRQAAGVGGDDRSGLAHGIDALQQLALDVEVFDDDFDDPVDLGQLGEVVFEVADGDQAIK